MFICIAGKNNIAVDVLKYILSIHSKEHIGIVCNKNETGKNSWQKSLRWFAQKWEVKEYQLKDIYAKDDVVFLSLEFDQIIKPELFHDARLYNIHFSLLPAYKGMYTSALPILNGEKITGVTFHEIDKGIDTGNIISQKRFLIKNQTCREVYHKYIKYGTELVISCIDDVLENKVNAVPQAAIGSTYYSKKSIDYKNLSLDLKQTAENIGRQIRAFNFREYQLMPFNEKKIISHRITEVKSIHKPGTIIFENQRGAIVSTIDYNIILYYDRFNELMLACEKGDIGLVYDICTVEEHINERNGKGWSPLIVATYFNQKEIVKCLLELGADIYATNNNGTNLLMYAKEAFLHYNDWSLFELFRKLGLSENTQDYFGNDLRYYMMQNGLLSQLNKDVHI